MVGGLNVCGHDDLAPHELLGRVAAGHARDERALLSTQVHLDPQQPLDTGNRH